MGRLRERMIEEVKRKLAPTTVTTVIAGLRFFYNQSARRLSPRTHGDTLGKYDYENNAWRFLKC